MERYRQSVSETDKDKGSSKSRDGQRANGDVLKTATDNSTNKLLPQIDLLLLCRED